MIAINTADPKISEYTNIQDVERMKPGLLKRTVEWFKYYKVHFKEISLKTIVRTLKMGRNFCVLVCFSFLKSCTTNDF